MAIVVLDLNTESSAKDLISTIWNVFDQNLEHTASIVNTFVDLLTIQRQDMQFNQALIPH